ncbi:MAG: 23S rRNA (uracil-5-)-methyltransferase RumA, partial [candidate division Zixibacteria bacterium]|nr:23S rRNA (uracil-5-)-methyltransferase RumA [candidate division Zixibacteria bacterium]
SQDPLPQTLKSQRNGEEKFSALIIDPPRAGLHPKAVKRIIEMQPEKLLYISCNPSTFARDAKSFGQAGYDLPAVQPVDMFPHTMHIELVGRFFRN